MKKNLLIIAIIVFVIATSCTKNDSLGNFNFNAKIASEITGDNISNAKVYIKVASEKVSGSYTYDALIDSFTIRSDANGNIFCNIKYNDDPNIFVKFEKTDDSYSTGFTSYKTEFALSELKNLAPVTFYVRKYESLIIHLRNIHPFDNSDAIGVDIYQEGTNYISSGVESIKNVGVSNQPWAYPAADDGKNPYWIGTNVNSIIYGKVQEGTTYQINWDVRKNQINTDHKSQKFITTLDSLNSYNILY